MLWLGIHFPDLSLEVFTEHPVASNQKTSQCQPTAHLLVESNRVKLLNSAAKNIGITVGTTLASAHSIAPKVMHHNRDVGKEAKLSGAPQELKGFAHRCLIDVLKKRRGVEHGACEALGK